MNTAEHCRNGGGRHTPKQCSAGTPAPLIQNLKRSTRSLGASDTHCDADKHTGITLKAPFLSNALKQPFSTTGVVSSLMQKCEAMAQQLNESTGGLETLMQNCPQYEGLLLMKCVPSWHTCPHVARRVTRRAYSRGAPNHAARLITRSACLSTGGHRFNENCTLS